MPKENDIKQNINKNSTTVEKNSTTTQPGIESDKATNQKINLEEIANRESVRRASRRMDYESGRHWKDV